MSEKLTLKEVLASVDCNFKELWKELDETQRKALKSEMFLLTRYVSSAKGQSREIQEHFVLTVNEFFNKNWNDLQKHPQLLWLLLCTCSHESKKVFFHEYIKISKTKSSNKVTSFLESIYPDANGDELDIMVSMYSKADLKALAKEHGYDDREIAKMF